MRPFAIPYAICLALALAPTPVAAQSSLCDDAALLARLHDGYAALVRARNAPAREAALVLLAVDLPAFDAERMARTLRARSIEADTDRLRDVADEAGRLARDRVEDRAGDPGLTRHSQNLYWLGGLILATGCGDRWSAGTAPGRGGLSARLPAIGAGDATDLRFGAAILGAMLAAAFLFAFFRSRTFRSGQLKRLPRKSVSFPARGLVLDGPKRGLTQDVHVLDLSVGGAKLAWTDAPEPKTSLTLVMDAYAIPANIVWKNDFYAGLLFEVRITQSDLEKILRLNDRKAGARSVRERISPVPRPPPPPVPPRRAQR